jgi:hypothetical protein
MVLIGFGLLLGLVGLLCVYVIRSLKLIAMRQAAFGPG